MNEGNEAVIRPVRPADFDALYDVALKTGANGADATALHSDPKLIGHIFAVPYARLEPESAFVIEDGAGVGGYIVGTADTRAFGRGSKPNGGRPCGHVTPRPSRRPKHGRPMSCAAGRSTIRAARPHASSILTRRISTSTCCRVCRGGGSDDA